MTKNVEIYLLDETSMKYATLLDDEDSTSFQTMRIVTKFSYD